jgi:signal peptidase I
VITRIFNKKKDNDKNNDVPVTRRTSEKMSFLAQNKKSIILVAIVTAGLVAVWFGAKNVLVVSNPIYLIPSESMLPSLNVGDVVVIRNGQGFSFEDLKVGDIIIFHTDDAGGRTIVHRIVEIYTDATSGERLVKTKGDNNPISYENFDYPIKQQDYYGKVIYVIPLVGLVSIQPYSYMISAAAVILISATFLVGILHSRRKRPSC